MERKKTAYITTFCLTEGIRKMKGRVSGDTFEDENYGSYQKPSWHLEEQEAREHAERIRQEKIALLEEQLRIVKDKNFLREPIKEIKEKKKQD